MAAAAPVTQSKDSARFFILLQQLDAWEAGTLLVERVKVSDGRELQLGLALSGIDGTDDSRRVFCSDVSLLTTAMFYLLVAVKEPRERLMLFSDATWFREGLEMQNDDAVFVMQQGRRLDGVLRHKGTTPKSLGTWFGVELVDRHAGEGTTDGMFQNKCFFQCDEDCAVFVSLSKIRLRPGDDDNDGVGAIPTAKIELSNRVVWVNDTGLFKATVRWFGYLPNEMGHELIVGVEFDDPVGKGTGRFRGQHIFHTKKGHASLIPISGLIQEDAMTTADEKPDIVNSHVEPEVPAAASSGVTLAIGSCVEVLYNPVRCGIIRWIGDLNEDGRIIAGLEMTDEDPHCYTCGTFKGKQIFPCHRQRAFFVSLCKCRPDSHTVDFRSRGSPESFCGRRKGIHGSANSSHMDVVLFCLFAFSGPFDGLLNRACAADDDSPASKLLKDVADLLRTQNYVGNDTATKLHQAFNKLCPSVCLDQKESDTSEFLNFLCRDVLKADPFLKLSTGYTSYAYQLVFGTPGGANPLTVQDLFEDSLFQHGANLDSITGPLIVRIPRGDHDTARKRVFPSLYLNIAKLQVGYTTGRCYQCNSVAQIDCRECLHEFCKPCAVKQHSKAPLNMHECKSIVADGTTPEKSFLLELFAIITKDGKQYRSYVKVPKGSRPSWLMFETTPDSGGAEAEPREPVIRPCPDVVEWLSGDRRASVVMQTPDVPNDISSIVSNASLCFYRFTEHKDHIYLKLQSC